MAALPVLQMARLDIAKAQSDALRRRQRDRFQVPARIAQQLARDDHAITIGHAAGIVGLENAPRFHRRIDKFGLQGNGQFGNRAVDDQDLRASTVGSDDEG